MSIPIWARRQLDADSPRKITEAIAANEKATACEVVPMVVLRSSSIDHLPGLLLCFFLTLFFAFNLTSYLVAFIQNIYILVFTVIAIFSCLSVLLARSSRIQRLILSDGEMEKQVRNRAELEFYRLGVKETRNSIGILIFISLAERKVVVLADKAIAEKLPSTTWDSVVHLILDQRKASTLTEGILAGLAFCGNMLVEHFPIQPGDMNELKNHLVIKE